MNIASNAADCKPKSAEILKICEYLQAIGVRFVIPGMYFIPPEMVISFIEDAEDLYAQLQGIKGVSEEDQAELRRLRDYQCHGKNKNGKRCKARVEIFHGTPHEWVEAGRPVPLCHKHGGR